MNTNTAKKTLTIDETAAALNWNVRNVSPRLRYLGYLEICGRCGGSGKFSYNQKDGDRCYGCGGSGQCLPTFTLALVDEIKSKVSTGALDAYLAESRRIAACRAQIKPVKDAIDTAWGKGTIHTAYEDVFRCRHDSALTVASVLFGFVQRVNALWDAANVAEKNTKAGADVVLAELNEILGKINALNEEFAAVPVEQHLLPR